MVRSFDPRTLAPSDPIFFQCGDLLLVGPHAVLCVSDPICKHRINPNSMVSTMLTIIFHGITRTGRELIFLDIGKQWLGVGRMEFNTILSGIRVSGSVDADARVVSSFQECE